MGVERSVTRWYVQRQLLLYEIAASEEKLRQLPASGESQPQSEERRALQQKVATAQEKLRANGTCPKPAMG